MGAKDDRGGAPVRLPTWALPAALCLGWAAVSSLLIMLNQQILRTGFPYPVCLASFGQLFSFAASWALVGTGAFERQASVTGRVWAAKLLPIGAFSAATLAFGNNVYLYLSVSFIQMLKAGTPVVTMLVLFAFGMERPRRPLVRRV